LRRTRKSVLLGVLSLTLVSVTPAFANAIIVRSDGPSAKTYPPGKSMPVKGKITLKAGDRVTVLDGSGTRILTGPGNFPVTASDSTATASAFGQFLRSTGVSQMRRGATRGTDITGPAQSPNIWFIDVTQSGPMCIADPASVTLWRPTSKAALPLTIKPVGGAKPVATPFAKGQAMADWPLAELPLADRAQYQLASGGQSEPRMVIIRLVKPAAPTPEATATALIKQGCTAQLDLLVETMAVTGE
jgi:hypothetical protein